MEHLSNAEILAAGLHDWRKLAQALHASFRVPDPTAGAAFVAAVVEAAVAVEHQPELRLVPGSVEVTVATRQDGRWVTQRDVDLARTISAIASRQGLDPAPMAVTQLELALDAADQDRVGPFWSALLTGSPDHVVLDSVLDPDGRVPSLWFQETDEHEVPRQRWHPDLWLAPEAAAGRIAAAVAAGGVVVDDAGAPSFTVLADPDGNRVCVCTAAGRD